MNTKISYLYRDASNYKCRNECVIDGTLTSEQISTIMACCDMGEYFIPRQVGLPERRFDHYDPEADHCWFELSEDSFQETEEPVTIDLSAAELVDRFAKCHENWDDTVAPQEPCEKHALPEPDEKEQFHIRPARPDEAGLFYAQHPSEDERLGAIGHVRMDFGKSGNEFWHTWWPRGPEVLNSPAFKAELQEVVDMMREDILKNRFAMERFCYEHGGKIAGGYVQNYGYIVETKRYRYCLRCNPSPGDYNAYLTCFDFDVQRQNMTQDKPLVGRTTYVGDNAQEFTDAEAFLQCVREELPYHSTTGFRYEVLTDDPALRKAVDDIAYDLYGEENPRQQEDYQKRPEQGMTFGGV